MDSFCNQKQVALIGMVSSFWNRLKDILSFHDLIICKLDDDLINIKAEKKHMSTQPRLFQGWWLICRYFVSPRTLKIGPSSQKSITSCPYPVDFFMQAVIRMEYRQGWFWQFKSRSYLENRAKVTKSNQAFCFSNWYNTPGLVWTHPMVQEIAWRRAIPHPTHTHTQTHNPKRWHSKCMFDIGNRVNVTFLAILPMM